MTSPPETGTVLDAVVVGAGFSGLLMLHKLREQGFVTRVLEASGSVGGTWNWNRYPGARCDVESMEYSYQFSEELQQEWQWSERYAAQPELLRYANHVADRFDLRRDITFNTRVVAATFNEQEKLWHSSTDTGESLISRFLIFATGCLSSTNKPDIPGLESFAGPVHHTGQWPHEGVDFSGQRVGIIGTGSSAIQSIPIIAKQAKQLTVFQRTANYSIPAHNGPIDKALEKSIKADYAGFRKRNARMPNALGSLNPRNDQSALEVDQPTREQAFETKWQRGGLNFMGAFNDLILDEEANDTAAEFVRNKIKSVVEDPQTAALLSPKQVIGCKRVCLDTGYYETFNRPNVSLVDIRAHPIEQITPAGLQVAGTTFEFDMLILATGFDAMTGTLLKMDILGRSGRCLRDKWQAGPTNYLGLTTSGFPNMFTITGPGSPSVLTNMQVSIDHHVNWITQCLTAMRASGRKTIEASDDAERQWVAHVNRIAGSTLYPTCNSWYLGANVPGKPRVFMPLLGFPAYADKCQEVAANNYEGFELS